MVPSMRIQHGCKVSTQSHDNDQYNNLRSDDYSGTRKWQLPQPLYLIGDLGEPLIKLASESLAIARVPRSCVSRLPGCHFILSVSSVLCVSKMLL